MFSAHIFTLEANEQNPRDGKWSKMTNALFQFFGLSVNDRWHDFAINDLLLDDCHPLLHYGFRLLCRERTDLHSRFRFKTAAAQSFTVLVNHKGIIPLTTCFTTTLWREDATCEQVIVIRKGDEGASSTLSHLTFSLGKLFVFLLPAASCTQRSPSPTSSWCPAAVCSQSAVSLWRTWAAVVLPPARW